MLKDEIGFGLGIGTTQGREGKVIVAKKYLKHSTLANKFTILFRHEYMHLFWLTENDPVDKYRATKQS